MNNKVSLYHLSNEYQQLFSKLYNPETGEIDEEVDTKLNEITGDIEKKCLAVASFIKKMEADKRELVFLKEELLRRDAAFDREISKWENYLENNMRRCGIKEIKCPYFTLKDKEQPWSVSVYDIKLIPQKFIRKTEKIIREIKPNKNAIRDHFIQTGEQLPGTVVIKKNKLEILISKI